MYFFKARLSNLIFPMALALTNEGFYLPRSICFIHFCDNSSYTTFSSLSVVSLIFSSKTSFSPSFLSLWSSFLSFSSFFYLPPPFPFHFSLFLPFLAHHSFLAVFLFLFASSHLSLFLIFHLQSILVVGLS